MNLRAALPPGTDPVAAAALGADLLARWNEPHRVRRELPTLDPRRVGG